MRVTPRAGSTEFENVSEGSCSRLTIHSESDASDLASSREVNGGDRSTLNATSQTRSGHAGLARFVVTIAPEPDVAVP